MTNNSIKFFENNSKLFFIIVISFFFLLSFYGLENGGDSYIKIFFVNNNNFLINELNFLNEINATHHISRWTLVLPLLFFSKFIDNPYLLNFLFSMFFFISTFFFLYWILQKENKIKYFLILIVIISLPFQSRYYSQPLTEYISFISILICCIYLNNKDKNLLIPAIFFFISYGAKVTNLYFLPGIIFYMYLNNDKKNIAKFLFFLFILFLIESLCFNIIFNLNFGRAELLLSGSHLSIVEKNYQFLTYISTILDKLFFSEISFRKNLYGFIILNLFLFNLFYVYKYKKKFFSIIAFINISYFLIYVLFILKIENKYIVIEPSNVPRHYLIFVSLSIFLVLENLFQIFAKYSNKSIYLIIFIFSILIFKSLIYQNNLIYKLNINSIGKGYDKIYFNIKKDKELFLFLNKYYNLEKNNFPNLITEIKAINKYFIGCEKKLNKRPCVKSLRKGNIIYN